MSLSNNRVEINLAALTDNFRAVRQEVGAVARVLAMVKSDAYGHGLLPVAKAIEKAGGTCFGVAEIDEGIALRQAGLTGAIVVFLGSDYFDEIIQYDLSPVVFDLDTLAGLSVAAERQKRLVGVHLKIDVGMGRLGIMPHQMEQFLRAIKTLPGLYLAGVMGHFSAADNIAGQGATKNQLQQFSDLVRNENICLQGMQAGEDGPLWHIANSAAIMHYPDTFFQLVRPGIALYGYHPGGGGQKCPFPLKPVMSFKTRVLQVKEVPAGYGVSYGHLFVTKRRTTLAVLPVGYADGYPRGLTGRAEVLIRGKRAAIRGRICMNACLADVTDIPGVSRGDEVVLLGSHSRNHFSGQDRSIFADEIAGWLDTISYEVLCLFGSSNDRVYLNEAS